MSDANGPSELLDKSPARVLSLAHHTTRPRSCLPRSSNRSVTPTTRRRERVQGIRRVRPSKESLRGPCRGVHLRGKDALLRRALFATRRRGHAVEANIRRSERRWRTRRCVVDVKWAHARSRAKMEGAPQPPMCVLLVDRMTPKILGDGCDGERGDRDIAQSARRSCCTRHALRERGRPADVNISSRVRPPSCGMDRYPRLLQREEGAAPDGTSRIPRCARRPRPEASARDTDRRVCRWRGGDRWRVGQVQRKEGTRNRSHVSALHLHDSGGSDGLDHASLRLRYGHGCVDARAVTLHKCLTLICTT